MLSTIHAGDNSWRKHQHELSPATIYAASVGMNCRRRQFMPGDNSCRNRGSISYEGPHLHYLRTSRERSRDSLQVLTSFEILSKKGGILNTFIPCIVSLQMHIFQAELHWSPIVPCRENEYVRQEQIYQENVVLLCCKSLCFSQKYILCVVVNPFDNKWKLK